MGELGTDRWSWAEKIVHGLRRAGPVAALVHLAGGAVELGVSALVATVVPNDAVEAIDVAVTTAVWLLAHGFAVAAVAGRLAEPPVPVRDMLRAAGRRVLPYVGWCVVVLGLSLAGIVPLLLAAPLMRTDGFAPGLVAGVVVAMVWLFAVTVAFEPTLAAVVLLERRGPRRCLALLRGRVLATTLRVLAINLTLGLYSGNLVDPVPGQVLQTLLRVPAWALVAVAAVVTYQELRAARDGGPCPTPGSPSSRPGD